MNFEKAKELSGWRSGNTKAIDYMLYEHGAYASEEIAKKCGYTKSMPDRGLFDCALVVDDTRIDEDGDTELHYGVFCRNEKIFLRNLLAQYTNNRKTMSRRLKKVLGLYETLDEKQKRTFTITNSVPTKIDNSALIGKNLWAEWF
ncbi:MAG: hypothetical protein BV456_00660 [Thermoplasmata archaeon M8B2D]|nr:MAG: hypothetical protein BV456_00660 [Thermoplasmata archaeon M8B2D]